MAINITNNAVRHIVTIDSADRDTSLYPYQGSYTIKLPLEYKNVSKIRLVSVEVPFSCYLHSAALGNTSLTILLATGTAQTVTIADGSYSIYTIGDAIADAVASNSYFSAQKFTVLATINVATMRLTLTGTKQFTVDTTSSSLDTMWGLGYCLGFLKNATYASGASTFVVTAPNVVNLSSVNYILLNIDTLNVMDESQPAMQYANNPSVQLSSRPGAIHNGAFAKIPLIGNPFDLIFRPPECCSFNVAVPSPVLNKLDRLVIKWKHHNQQIVHFNNCDHSFTLEIECQERAFVR